MIRRRRTRQLYLFPERSTGTWHDPRHESPGVEAGRRIRRFGQIEHELNQDVRLSRAADLTEQAGRIMLADLDEWRLVNQQRDLSVG